MVALIISLGVVAVLALVFVPIWLFERKQDREEAEWQERHQREMNEVVRWMAARSKEESDAKSRVFQAVNRLPWSEVRFLCECMTERPCECPSRWAAAMRILKARAEIERESV